MTQKNVYRTILIVLTVTCGLCAIASAPGALTVAVMAFDAPGSEHYVWAWVMSLTILSIPLWVVAAALVGWMAAQCARGCWCAARRGRGAGGNGAVS